MSTPEPPYVFKTLEGWRQSKLSLSQYLQVGNFVDDGIVSHFVNCVPPAYHSGWIIQMGEPYDYRDWGATYLTLESTGNGVWWYAGSCHLRQTMNIE